MISRCNQSDSHFSLGLFFDEHTEYTHTHTHSRTHTLTHTHTHTHTYVRTHTHTHTHTHAHTHTPPPSPVFAVELWVQEASQETGSCCFRLTAEVARRSRPTEHIVRKCPRFRHDFCPSETDLENKFSGSRYRARTDDDLSGSHRTKVLAMRLERTQKKKKSI